MRKFLASIVFVLTFSLISSIAVFAQETLVVTSVNSRGWSTADTRPGGAVDFVEDTTAPGGGSGALQLTTDNTATAKAQFLHGEDTPLSDVTDLGYYTRYVSGPPHAAASYQLVVNLCGTTGFTTFVYEPYQNGTVDITGAWQQWDVDGGQMWSSRTVTCGSSGVVAGAGGPPFYTLSYLQTAFPNAVVIGFGVNIGSNNPSYNVLADLVTFNLTTYDFEVYSTPSTLEDCKRGGWSTFNPATGPFKNQGQCVSSTVPQ